MAYQLLNNGVKMPIHGFGVFQIWDAQECEMAVQNALQAGYRLIDTAASYYNEKAVGRALQHSQVPRDQLFITSKLWVTDTGYEAAKKAFERSCQYLQVDYLDLYLIHQPYGDIYGTWRALEELYQAGKIRAIGVSNFSAEQVMTLGYFNHVFPAINQIQVNPWRQQLTTVPYLQEKQVTVEAWSPFAQGKQGIFAEPHLVAIAQKHQKSVGQVILQWLSQRQIVTIAKTVHPQRMRENLASFDFQLSSAEMVEIQKLNQQQDVDLQRHDPEIAKRLAQIHHDQH
ncbi:aldo/keto reductase [Pediococcus siamensis]|uniref:aldo/keto reductase n=1 Tax=Pediococcus siamensis TaxID=381829 RepID=UPI0039A29F9F